MKALFVVLCWLLIGFFYWSMSQNCCATAGQESSVAVLEGNKLDTKEQAITETDSSSQSPTLDTLKEKETVEIDSIVDSTVDSDIDYPEETEPVIDYNYDADNTIMAKDGVSIIPLKPDDTFSDEIKAHLEQICKDLSHNFSKVKIEGYNNQDIIAAKTAVNMENFLIRCGVSPFRISRTNSKIDTADSFVKMSIID